MASLGTLLERYSPRHTVESRCHASYYRSASIASSQDASSSGCSSDGMMEVMLASSAVAGAAQQMHGQSSVPSTACGPLVCSLSELEAPVEKLRGATRQGPSALVGTGCLCSLCSRLAEQLFRAAPGSMQI